MLPSVVTAWDVFATRQSGYLIYEAYLHYLSTHGPPSNSCNFVLFFLYTLYEDVLWLLFSYWLSNRPSQKSFLQSLAKNKSIIFWPKIKPCIFINQAWTNCTSDADRARSGAQNLWDTPDFLGAHILSCKNKKTYQIYKFSVEQVKQ